MKVTIKFDTNKPVFGDVHVYHDGEEVDDASAFLLLLDCSGLPNYTVLRYPKDALVTVLQDYHKGELEEFKKVIK